jgi:hypothetical protein
MQLIGSGTLSNLDLRSVAATLATLTAPANNAKRYLTELRFTNLPVAHSIQIQEDYSGTIHYSPPQQSPGHTTLTIEVETTVENGTPNVLIKAIDLSGNANNATVHWMVNEIDVKVIIDLSNIFNGSKSITMLFRDEGLHPVPLVAYVVNGVGAGVASPEGLSTINLNPGTYTIRASPTSGVLFSSQDITVANDGDLFAITGMSEPLPPTPVPDFAVGWLDVFDAINVLAPGIPFQFRVKKLFDADGVSLPPPEDLYTTESNVEGRLIVNFRPLTSYEGRRGKGEDGPTGKWVHFTSTASGTTFRLPNI